MPRKNGKSTLAAGLALYGLVMDGEEGAEVYSCAGDRQQGRIVFDEARQMAIADPLLADLIIPRVRRLEVPATHGIYRVLSADAGLQQGLSPSWVIFDEVHVQPDEDLWQAMTLGSGARRQPLVIGITTAGYDEGSLAYRLYDYGRKIERGEIDDPSFFFRWYGAPPRSDHRDPQVWAIANPALDSFLKADDLAASVRSTPESAFRRYRLNEWVSAERFWLPTGGWAACKAPDLGLSPKLPLGVGIDIGISHDYAAVVCAQLDTAADRVVVRASFWANPYPARHSLHDGWRLDIEEVRDHLRQLRKTYPTPTVQIDDRWVAGPAFYYDPWSFRESAQLLEDEGLAMIEVPQSDARMVPAAKTLYDLVVTGRLAHDGDPTLAAHLANVVAKPRGENGWRISKPRGSAKMIDGAVALAMALTEIFDLVPAPKRRVAFLV